MPKRDVLGFVFAWLEIPVSSFNNNAVEKSSLSPLSPSERFAFALSWPMTVMAIVLMLYLSIWRLDFLPYMDLPLHIYMAKIISNIESYNGAYFFEYGLMPNQLWQWVLAGLNHFYSPMLSAKILLTAAFLVSIAGCYRLSNVLCDQITPYWLWVFAAAQFHYFFFMGFLQFYLSLALIPWVILGLLQLQSKPESKPESKLKQGPTALFLALSVAVFFFMHFMAMAVLLLSLLIFELIRAQSFLDVWNRFRAYVPAFIVVGVLIALIPPGKASDSLFEYHWFRKFLSPVLWLMKPMVLSSILLGSIGLGLLSVKFKVLREALTPKFCLILGVFTVIFIALPSQIRAMADAELRLYYPITVAFLMFGMMLIQRHAKNANVILLSTGVIFTACFVLLFQAISAKHDDLFQLRAQMTDSQIKSPQALENTTPLLVNYQPKDQGALAKLDASINGLFYNYQYYEYLSFSPESVRIPYVYPTSILRRSEEVAYTRAHDYLLPWGAGPFAEEFYQYPELKKPGKTLLVPISGKNDISSIIGNRNVIRSEHWILAF